MHFGPDPAQPKSYPSWAALNRRGGSRGKIPQKPAFLDNALLSATDPDVRGVRDTPADATWLWGRISQRGDSSSRLRSPSLYTTAAHARATTVTPRMHQVPNEGSEARKEFGALRARFATASDLLNVTKALLVWVATQSLRHRWSDGQFPADLAPQNAPQARTLIGSAFENLLLTWVELSGLEPPTSCMP